MLTLGIETSCDETSVSVTEGVKVLANVVSSSVRLHRKYGGVVPEIASRFHVEYILKVASKALEVSGARLKDIGLISVTKGPGLVGAILIGVSFAKSLSYGLKVPLIGVNHVLAHLYSSFLTKGNLPRFPFVGLVASGGHTALFYCEDIGKQKLLGQTRDDAVGEAFDKVAKILSLGYPGGPVIEKRARLALDKDRVRFPRSYLDKESLDFSFSGLKTAVLYYARDNLSMPNTQYAIQKNVDKALINDICYAFQEAALDVLVEKAFRTARRYDTKEIVIGGGVIANARLREKFSARARFLGGCKVYFPREIAYCVDNAAMVGSLGEALYKRGYRSDLYLSAEPNLTVTQ